MAAAQNLIQLRQQYNLLIDIIQHTEYTTKEFYKKLSILDFKILTSLENVEVNGGSEVKPTTGERVQLRVNCSSN